MAAPFLLPSSPPKSANSFKNLTAPPQTYQTQTHQSHYQDDSLFSNVIPFKAAEPLSQKFSLQSEQTDLAKAQHQIQQLNKQVLLLTKKLEEANAQTEFALGLVKTQPTPQTRRSKLSTIPTTYVVPKRSRAQHIDQCTSAVPMGVMLMLFVAGLAAAIATALPVVSLWGGLSPFFIALIRGLFVAIAFSTVTSFFLEIWQSKLA